jgi:predicted glycosyltransferase
LRFVALKAYHDTDASGLSLRARRRLVQELSKFGRVFITAEGELPPDLEPYRYRIPTVKMHDALFYATMLVSDSQTMTVEAAVLGTPAIRCNSFVGRCSIIEEIQHKYGLTYGFLPQDSEQMFARINELLSDQELDAEWQRRRARMLEDKIDLTAWMVDLVDRYPQSLSDYR